MGIEDKRFQNMTPAELLEAYRKGDFPPAQEPEDFDPTAFDIEFDPTVQRMRGHAVHGNTPFDVPYMSAVAEKLYQGGCTNGLVLPPYIDYVMSLYPWERYEMNHDVKGQQYVKMYDSLDQSFDQLEDLAQQVIEWRKDGNVLVHCFPTGTMVGGLTSTNIEKASEVLGQDGKIHNVSYHHLDPYDGPLVKIETTGILPISCTPEHPFMVVRPYFFPKGFKAKPGTKSLERVSTVTKHYKTQPTWIEAKDIRVGDYLVCPIPNLDRKQAEPISWLAGDHHNLKDVGPLTPDNDTAWMLGFYAADGGTHGEYSISFVLSPKDDLKRLCGVWKRIGLTPTVTQNKNYTRVVINSKTVCSSMREWFGSSDNKRLPEFLFTHDWPLRSVVEGYADGDGYTNSRGATTIHTISQVLVEQVRMMLLMIGESPTVSLAQRHSGYDNAKQGYNIQWNPKSFQRHTAHWRGMYLVPVTDISQSWYSGEVHNLSVDDVETYIVNGALVHNCQAGLNRSALLTARVLMLDDGLTSVEAITLIREQRSPACLCNKAFEDYLLDLDGHSFNDLYPDGWKTEYY